MRRHFIGNFTKKGNMEAMWFKDMIPELLLLLSTGGAVVVQAGCCLDSKWWAENGEC